MKVVFKKKTDPDIIFGSLNSGDIFSLDNADTLYMKINGESAFCIFCRVFKLGLEGFIYDFDKDRVVKPRETELIVYDD